MLSKVEYEQSTAASREQRIAWWTRARFGLFVHFGLYSVIGRHEWVQAIECIPAGEYARLARQFKPRPGCAREWARLARAAGMKYMVMTAKHHEGFCLWNTKETAFNAVKAGCGRDLVAEYVDACREYGLKVGIYYSLMDWHHPDGGSCSHDPSARRRFLDFTQGCVRELMSHYGKIDILWYDGTAPMAHHEGWESVAMNQMVRALQPSIIINNRSCLEEDFGTPEEQVAADQRVGRHWEACMTFNRTSWGYMHSAAADAYSARQILRMLNTACDDAGNLLLNIGPLPDGSVPPESVEPLLAVGRWLKLNGRAVYGLQDRTAQRRYASMCGPFSQKGRTLYFWVTHWPGREFGLGGFQTRLKSARFLVGGEKIDFEQKPNRILFRNMPEQSPDKLVGITVLKLDFAEPPVYIHHASTAAIRFRNKL